MRSFWHIIRVNVKISGWMPAILAGISVTLLALTHGPLELARLWQHHFIENCEAFFPLTYAFITAPLMVIDHEFGMIELTSSLPRQHILLVRWIITWGMATLVNIVFVSIMISLWGPVRLGAGILAALGPLFLESGLALWASALTKRVAVGYLVAIALPVSDLIVRVLGGFQAFPLLQFVNLFAFRWPITSVNWQIVAVTQFVTGFLLMTMAIIFARWLYQRMLS
ncbi:hypothetical protein SAMN00768000_2790 [Sulfobacillus thermosulfidooxidans DSM 9293]|uniref:Fluoroquinolone transport system permease protein n=2 Tax=Sulfobacillus thermosulfidooxidans TaxID=28034 RepID=A0A1W1WJ88_SULTA|nr:hypothetical protein [Sulfobacillus thermosulfidooxidans]PSR27492.1 MAG: hypothetical protein C7B47_07985 [Sulfobacillus thermosulfidooxidans]SMC06378.1 hypothetical protein SAMN00768000_2790 [Sulfobacillus thermosulfidooxidans DSM 9293]